MRKHQTPNTKHQKSSKLQISNARHSAKIWSLVFGFWCFFGVWCLVFGVSDEGFGPPISVPRDLPKSETHKLPARNWIDQTTDEAARKRRGCLECHKGI